MLVLVLWVSCLLFPYRKGLLAFRLNVSVSVSVSFSLSLCEWNRTISLSWTCCRMSVCHVCSNTTTWPWSTWTKAFRWTASGSRVTPRTTSSPTPRPCGWVLSVQRWWRQARPLGLVGKYWVYRDDGVRPTPRPWGWVLSVQRWWRQADPTAMWVSTECTEIMTPGRPHGRVGEYWVYRDDGVRPTPRSCGWLHSIQRSNWIVQSTHQDNIHAKQATSSVHFYSFHGGFRNANHPSCFGNQNVTISILLEKPKKWPPCFLHALNHSNGAKDCCGWFRTKHGTGDQRYQLQSAEAEIHFNAESDWSHCACTSQHSTAWWSDGKRVRTEAGLRAQCWTLNSHLIYWNRLSVAESKASVLKAWMLLIIVL